MLDDKNFISERDPQNLLAVVADSPWQLTYKYVINNDELLPKQANEIDNIIVTGMGGSALAAETFKVWPGLRVPLVVCRDYTLPLFVNERTLVIVSSFSGNTEETVSALEDALKKNAQVVIVAHGGKLKQIAEDRRLAHVILPEAVQPRIAAFYSLKALVAVLERIGFVKEALKQLDDLGNTLRFAAKEWLPEVPTESNPAKRLAEEIMGKTPIIYGGILSGSAYKWKISFNENAKNLAWVGQLPEFNHNEFIGWSSHPIEKPFAIINLISSFDHEQVKKRFIVSEKLLSGMRPESIDIQAKGRTLIEQIIWTDLFGSMITVYVAILNGVNPTPVDLVEKFKEELDK